MKKLILTVSILSFAALGKSQDTTRCYGKTELRKIAKTAIQKQECDSLLKITNRQLKVKMELLADDDAQLILLKQVVSKNEGIIANKQTQLDETTKLLKREVRRKKVWKFVSSSSMVILGAVIVVLALR